MGNSSAGIEGVNEMTEKSNESLYSLFRDSVLAKIIYPKSKLQMECIGYLNNYIHIRLVSYIANLPATISYGSFFTQSLHIMSECGIFT